MSSDTQQTETPSPTLKGALNSFVESLDSIDHLDQEIGDYRFRLSNGLISGKTLIIQRDGDTVLKIKL